MDGNTARARIGITKGRQRKGSGGKGGFEPRRWYQGPDNTDRHIRRRSTRRGVLPPRPATASQNPSSFGFSYPIINPFTQYQTYRQQLNVKPRFVKSSLRSGCEQEALSRTYTTTIGTTRPCNLPHCLHRASESCPINPRTQSPYLPCSNSTSQPRLP